MSKRRLAALAFASLALGGCETIGLVNDHLPDGPLSKADIDRCLAIPHKLDRDMIYPQPEPGRVFKPGYNFSIKAPDGTYKYGYQQAFNGHLLVRYPAHGLSNDYQVTRRSGVVYFGNLETSCR